jgi:sulfotransferase
MNQLHFCGGLPRSGSTLLMNLLQQNPRIFTTGTCALSEILRDKILIKSRYSETFQAMSTEQADRAMYGLIHGATKGWFEALTNKPVVISKRHGWSGLFHLFPKSKYICLIRDLRDVVESFERVNSKTLSLHSYGDSNTVIPAMHIHEKYKHYFNESNAFSVNLQTEVPRLMEVFKKDNSKVIFIRYEDFTKEPIYILKKLYNFLVEDYFDHDLMNINQSELFEHDHAYFREKTDHETLPKFRFYSEPKRILSNEFHQRVVKENIWFYESFYPEVLNNER